MKKKFICSLIFCLSCLSLWAQESSSSEPAFKHSQYIYGVCSDIEFKNDCMVIHDYEKGNAADDYVTFNKKFKFIKQNGIPFLAFDDGEKFLILSNEDLLVLYNKNNQKPEFFAARSESVNELIESINPKTVKASSELKEKDCKYGAENISNVNISEPWVEAADGNGIGEEIQFSGNCRYLYIFNGYVSFEKPYLYEANSRLKNIQISCQNGDNEKTFIVNLRDDPAPQKIDLGFHCTSTIKIKILDVYEGTQYQDTCLSGILMKVY